MNEQDESLTLSQPQPFPNHSLVQTAFTIRVTLNCNYASLLFVLPLKREFLKRRDNFSVIFVILIYGSWMNKANSGLPYVMLGIPTSLWAQARVSHKNWR